MQMHNDTFVQGRSDFSAVFEANDALVALVVRVSRAGKMSICYVIMGDAFFHSTTDGTTGASR
jgi:hypothetical protein